MNLSLSESLRLFYVSLSLCLSVCLSVCLSLSLYLSLAGPLSVSCFYLSYVSPFLSLPLSIYVSVSFVLVDGVIDAACSHRPPLQDRGFNCQHLLFVSSSFALTSHILLLARIPLSSVSSAFFFFSSSSFSSTSLSKSSSLCFPCSSISLSSPRSTTLPVVYVCSG